MRLKATNTQTACDELPTGAQKLRQYASHHKLFAQSCWYALWLPRVLKMQTKAAKLRFGKAKATQTRKLKASTNPLTRT